jgi:6-phosphogluconolactonase
MAGPGETADVRRRTDGSLEPRWIGKTKILVASPSTFTSVGAEVLAATLRGSGSRDLSLALSGGSTPGPIYEELADLPGLPWKRTRIYFADERAVPPEDAASNYRLVRRVLIDRAPIPARSVHRMEAERPDLNEAAERYERQLPTRLDVLVLGIGEDGHTASLFPGSPNLTETVRRVAPARSPSPPTERLTITPLVIRSADSIFLFARGRTKASAVREALFGEDEVSRYPAQLARRGTWVLDTEAADQLG